MVAPFKHHKRSHLILGQSGIGRNRFIDRRFHTTQILNLRGKELAEQSAVAHPLQNAADFRLKQNDQRQNAPFKDEIKQVTDCVQLKA